MTDEQIKQNAEEYAEQNKVNFSEDKNFEVYDYDEQKEAYLTGAHRRDEEINELEKKVSALETVIVTARATISMQEAIIKDLRNTWISVEERLPDEGKHVFVRTVVGSYSVGQYIHPQWYITGIPSAHGLVSVTHWMPILELKKGE